MCAGSIFFDMTLPTPTTWFYFSGLLAVALFFKFSRFFCMRNLDVLALYLFTPGLLLLMEPGCDFWGFFWLLVVCFYFLVRCLADLALVRRPALGANLDLAGLGWLAGALFLSLAAIAGREPARPPVDDSAGSADPGGGQANYAGAGDTIPRLGTRAMETYAPAGVDGSRLRLWAERSLAVLCHLSVVVALVLIGWRHFDDVTAGMAAATFYLLLPYPFLLLPDSPVGVGRWDHAWPMALMLWTVFTYRRPVLAGAFMGVAAGTSPFLLFALPAWVSFYRTGRVASRFLLSFLLFAGLGVGVLGGLLWFYEGEPPPALGVNWLRFEWQPWKLPRAPLPSVWQPNGDKNGNPAEENQEGEKGERPETRAPQPRVYAAYRVPLFIASLALVITSAIWPNPKNLAHVLALSAAALLSVQFWYADHGGVYILWFLPLILLLVFRPNLTGAQLPVSSNNDFLARLARRLLTLLRRLIPHRRPTALTAPTPPVVRE